MPVVIEMKENETAKLENQPMLRRKVCRYPNCSIWAASPWVSAVSRLIFSLMWSAPSGVRAQAFLRTFLRYLMNPLDLGSSGHQPAPVDVDHGSGHETGVIAQQEPRHPGDVDRLPDALDQRPPHEVLHDLRGTGYLSREAGLHGPRVDAVHPDVVRRELERDALGEHLDAALRGAVVHLAVFTAGRDDLALHGAEVDDRPAVLLTDHFLGERLSAEKLALQVDIDNAVPLLLRQLQEWRHGDHAGVVDQVVQPAKPHDCGGNERLHLGLAGHVGVHVQRVRALLDQFLRRGFPLVVEDVRRDHRHALFGQVTSDAPPDAGRGPRHDGDSLHVSPPFQLCRGRDDRPSGASAGCSIRPPLMCLSGRSYEQTRLNEHVEPERPQRQEQGKRLAQDSGSSPAWYRPRMVRRARRASSRVAGDRTADCRWMSAMVS